MQTNDTQGSLRAELLETLAEDVEAVSHERPVRVGIDGVDGAGKTMLADELAAVVGQHGHPVIRASGDSFHHPRSFRYRQGRDSPEGYFHDSFDYPAVRSNLLDPLGPGGSLRYRVAAFDHHADQPIDSPLQTPKCDARLIFDGSSLHRAELVNFWDFSIFLDTSFSVTVARRAVRDGGTPLIDDPRNRRYVEGQRLYLRTCDPRTRATVIIHNDDIGAPFVVRR